jgi:hypothetical protein
VTIIIDRHGPSPNSHILIKFYYGLCTISDRNVSQNSRSETRQSDEDTRLCPGKRKPTLRKHKQCLLTEDIQCINQGLAETQSKGQVSEHRMRDKTKLFCALVTCLLDKACLRVHNNGRCVQKRKYLTGVFKEVFRQKDDSFYVFQHLFCHNSKNKLRRKLKRLVDDKFKSSVFILNLFQYGPLSCSFYFSIPQDISLSLAAQKLSQTDLSPATGSSVNVWSTHTAVGCRQELSINIHISFKCLQQFPPNGDSVLT